MEVDTGATLSVISEETYKSLWPNPHSASILSHSPLLKTYTGEPIKVKGQLEVNVSYNDQQKNLNLLVTEGNRLSLINSTQLATTPQTLDWLCFFQVNRGIFFLQWVGMTFFPGSDDELGFEVAQSEDEDEDTKYDYGGQERHTRTMVRP